jgi:hypothetical protein
MAKQQFEGDVLVPLYKSKKKKAKKKIRKVKISIGFAFDPEDEFEKILTTKNK